MKTFAAPIPRTVRRIAITLQSMETKRDGNARPRLGEAPAGHLLACRQLLLRARRKSRNIPIRKWIFLIKT
ncbi:hypothetical protein [Azotobacter vinelandii]|uniref:hypothetical protein n=1 Tax=Azotobacter vinelandii TaxID=354 RepID=UPI0022F2C8EA|nr:hypothetical protein [Azotobacter vinelandii]